MTSKSWGNFYSIDFENWYDYMNTFLASNQSIIREFLAFSNHLDIEFIGILSQIDTSVSRIIRWQYGLKKDNQNFSSLGFQIFSAIEFLLAADDYFSSTNKGLSKIVMDRNRKTQMKYSKVPLKTLIISFAS